METELVCSRCRNPKSEADFYLSRTLGKNYRKKICKQCDNEGRKSRKQLSWDDKCTRDPEHRNKVRLGEQRRRKDPKFTAKYITVDSRKSDKRFGRANDLTRDWVGQSISVGCSYCGETELRMTLDRIDNQQGHLKSNVRPACIRCNYLRSDMPYAAWLLLVDGVRAAQQARAFGDWVGRAER